MNSSVGRAYSLNTNGCRGGSVHTGCLPIFEYQFKTLFQDQLFWNLIPVCTINDKQVLGNGTSAATQEIRWPISKPFPRA